MNSTTSYPDSEFDWDIDEATRERWYERNVLWLLFLNQGRIPRAAFWCANLMVGVANFIAATFAASFIKDAALLKTVNAVIAVALLWPSLAIANKRWHDRDKSGWWSLIYFIPVVGLWGIIESGFLRGTRGPNRYGAES